MSAVGLADVLTEGLAHRWVAYAGLCGALRLLQTDRWLSARLGVASIWQEAAWAWGVSPGGPPRAAPAAHWRRACCLHAQLRAAWGGQAAPLAADAREELRRQGLQDLEVHVVKFLAGDDALVLGHSKGTLSTWGLGAPAAAAAPGPALGGPTLPPPPGPHHAGLDGLHSPARDASGRHSPRPGGSPASAGPPRSGGEPLAARVLGVFRTTRRHDVQDLDVSPPAAEQPVALLLGSSVWLAAAVGPSAYVWESTGQAGLRRPTEALGAWALRATLRHSALLASAHQAVLAVRLGSGCGSEPRSVTLGEDGVLRGWAFGEGHGGLDGELLWQREAGDARQVLVAVFPSGTWWGCGTVALARAATRSFEVLRLDTGERVAEVAGAWPTAAPSSLPQTVVFDTCGFRALFSSITDAGGGLLAEVDLRTGAALSREVVSPLAGVGRVLRVALTVPAAGVVVAVVNAPGQPTELLEVWGCDALGIEGAAAAAPLAPACRRPSAPRFRGRVPRHVANVRLLAAGGRRLALVDPTAMMKRGELRVLEWRPRPPPPPAAAPRAARRGPGLLRLLPRAACCAVAGPGSPRCWGGLARLWRGPRG